MKFKMIVQLFAVLSLLGSGCGWDQKTNTNSSWGFIACGFYTTVAVKEDRSLYAWGANSDGQLGDNTRVGKAVPTRIGSASDWKTTAGGYSHTVALKEDGSLYAWGNNGRGQLGVGLPWSTTPRQVTD